MYIYLKTFGVLECNITEDCGYQAKVFIPDIDTHIMILKKSLYKDKETLQVKEYKKQSNDINKKIQNLEKNLRHYQDIFNIKQLQETKPELFLM